MELKLIISDYRAGLKPERKTEADIERFIIGGENLTKTYYGMAQVLA